METETIFRKVSVKRFPENDIQVYVICDYYLSGGKKDHMATSYYRNNGYGWGGRNLPVTHWLEETTLPDIIQEKDREIEKLKAFKDYVHDRLDKMNIPTHPEGEHSKHGCRIGDRLDIVNTQIQELKEDVLGFTEWIRQEVYLIQAEKWVQLWKSDTAYTTEQLYSKYQASK